MSVQSATQLSIGAFRWGIAAWLLRDGRLFCRRCGCTFDDARAAGDRRRDELHAFGSSGWIKPQPARQIICEKSETC